MKKNRTTIITELKPLLDDPQIQTERIEKAVGTKTKKIRVKMAPNKEEIAAKKAELRRSMGDERASMWRIGDLTVELLDVYGCSLAELADELHYSKPRLCQLCMTAKAFAPDERRSDVPYSHHEFAREACRRANREAKKFDLNNVTLKPTEFLSVMVAEKIRDKTAATARATTSVRDEYRKRNPIVAPTGAALYNMPNEQLLDKLANEHVLAKLIVLDPPYGSYKKFSSGRLDTSTCAALHRDGHSLTEDEAIKTTVETIRRCPNVLAKGGVILLWQGIAHLRRPILDAIEESGLEVFVTCVWDKGQPQPSDMTWAYTTQTEYMHVLRRKGEDLLFHDHERMTNVFRHKRIQPRASDVDEKHIWQKPLDLCEDVVLLHTFEGDLVLDLFGCSAQTSIAAAKHKRAFIYCESFLENYELAKANIGDFQKTLGTTAFVQPTRAADTEETATVVAETSV